MKTTMNAWEKIKREVDTLSAPKDIASIVSKTCC